MPFWVALNFQTLTSTVNSYLETLNDFTLVWLAFIMVTVTMLGCYVINSFSFYGKLNMEKVPLEIFWTVFPILILVSIACPSLFLLNLQDTVIPKGIFKLIGNQWNWQSESGEDLDHLIDYQGFFYKSSFENPLILDLGIMQSVVTSSDVLHSFGIPELGIKIDSAPGRLNSVSMEFTKPGIYWGSCYELCGSGHSSMPFSILALLK